MIISIQLHRLFFTEGNCNLGSTNSDRTIFKSIRKFIVFQSTVNCASMTIVFLGPFLGFDFPLTLIQLLWVNLVMDTLAALAFGGEPALLRYMDEKPVARDAPIITVNMWSSIIINGLFIAFLCIAALMYQPLRLFFVRDGVPRYTFTIVKS